MIVECSYCESKVDAKVLAEHDSFGADDAPFKVILLECPVCKNGLLAGQDYLAADEWDDPGRLWPDPERHPHWNLPDVVRESLSEAQKCYKATAYGACAVMCGRVLEGIGAAFEAKDRTLHGGLRELLEKGIIDRRLYEWSEALRRHRNIGAHASTERIGKEDARDLLDFALAICDYVFVLTAKFKVFMERQQEKEEAG